MWLVYLCYDPENGTRIRIRTWNEGIQEIVSSLRHQAIWPVLVLSSNSKIRRGLRKPPKQENEILPRRLCEKSADNLKNVWSKNSWLISCTATCTTAKLVYPGIAHVAISIQIIINFPRFFSKHLQMVIDLSGDCCCTLRGGHEH